MSLVSLDGSQFTDIDTFLLGALTLAGATGNGFEMEEVGKIAGNPGVTARHVTAIRTMAAVCNAEIEGDALSAKKVRFVPTNEARARDRLVDIGEVTGRPSPESVTPLMEMLIPVLARAAEDSLFRFRGANATPFAPSAFWLRETLVPMLTLLDMTVGVEIEKWGWYPDGGGETTLLVEGGWTGETASSLIWQERGDCFELWALVALSPRMNRRVGKQMLRATQEALANEPIQYINVEETRVRSPGPGSGLFIALQFEQTTAGFESVSYKGMSAEQVVEDATASMSNYFWSDAAFEPELARSLMLPLALTGREATFTTSEITLPMRVLEYLIPRFLPLDVTVSKHPTGGQVTFKPR
ncbi:MAG: hypothetical protein M3220_20105 [Chloroflexota bacterium]|nr:hypothetical protein [Chloroflexota bacterium]